MENKKYNLTKILLCLLLIVVLTGCVALSSMGATANAATVNPSPDAEPLGLMTKISLKLGTTGAEVWADAHNDFTLGKSTVQVYVFLYSSPTYKESYTEMTLENQKFVSDLDIYQSVRTSMPINGVQKFWKARVKYKLDSNDWVAKETEALLIDVDGNLV
ncbi:MAG: N-succinylarginine dihydrolase [Clostridiales bacterium]|nr:N-succinylarginine dihydrolase [Clostridiales bacterium]